MTPWGPCQGYATAEFLETAVRVQILNSMCSNISIAGKKHKMRRAEGGYEFTEYISRQASDQHIYLQVHSNSWKTRSDFKLYVPPLQTWEEHDCEESVHEIHHYHEQPVYHETVIVEKPVYVHKRRYHSWPRKHLRYRKHHRVRVHRPGIHIRTEIPPFRVRVKF